MYSALIFTGGGIPVVIVNRHEPGRWLGWWIGIAIVALGVGLVCSLAARSRAPQLRQMLDGLTPAQYRQATKAVLSGPIPADPAVQRAAARLAERWISEMSPRFHKVLVWTMAANVVIQLGSSAFGSKINFTTLSSATMFAAMAVFWWLYPPLLEARAQLLAGARPAPLPESGEGWAAMQNRP
ncbi:hypothetical protein D2E61_08495 [Mycobacteroides abscessus]|nr:hypothetical protein D2E61_08495 [Mycobacteroides abscessus]